MSTASTASGTTIIPASVEGAARSAIGQGIARPLAARTRGRLHAASVDAASSARNRLPRSGVVVSDSIAGEGLPERIVTYTAKDFHFAPEPPEDSVILATYVAAVELGFTQLGDGELDHYLATTPYPVERVEAELVIDRIPEGNPRAW